MSRRQEDKRGGIHTLGVITIFGSSPFLPHTIWVVPVFYSNLIYCKNINANCSEKIMQHDMTRWTHQCLLVFCQWSHCGLAK